MPYKNIWEDNGVYRKYSNHITGQEILQAAQDVHGHALFDSIRYVINDLLEVTKHDISPHEIRSLAAIDKAASITNSNIKIAIVATIPTIHAFSSLYSELINKTPFSCEIFTCIGKARKWVI